MTIIDKRKSGKNKSVDNRQRFIKRYKQHIKKNMEDQEGSILDVDSKRKAKLSKKDMQEPDFSLDQSTGSNKRVLPGNKEFSLGDQIRKPPSGSGKGGSKGSPNSDGEEDEFSFVLTKEEFIEIYFSEMALPNFVKQSLKDNKKVKLVRAGYTKDGIPPRLDMLKTFKQAIARRIASKSHEEKKKERFLDDIDLRYKLFVKKPLPVIQAHVFFLMDVSGSMGSYEKDISKKFFALLYMFLNKEYEKVTVSFVRHTEEAKEVTENEFFYSRESGGTIVSSGLRLLNEIIDNKINLNETNVYVAQSSDGDNYEQDEGACIEEMVKLLSKVQYFAYIQVEQMYRRDNKARYDEKDVMDIYKELEDVHKNLRAEHVNYESEVYPVLKSLFEKGN